MNLLIPMDSKKVIDGKVYIITNRRTYEQFPEMLDESTFGENLQGWIQIPGTKEKILWNRRSGVRRYIIQRKTRRENASATRKRKYLD